MVHVTADGSLSLKDLGLFFEPVEISDADGKLLGLFVPANLERGKRMTQQLDSEIDWDEIERRAQSNEPSHTTREVFEHLRSLAQDQPTRKHLQELIDELEERDRCSSP
jgi:hypothetical protein